MELGSARWFGPGGRIIGGFRLAGAGGLARVELRCGKYALAEAGEGALLSRSRAQPLRLCWQWPRTQPRCVAWRNCQRLPTPYATTAGLPASSTET